MKNIWKNIKKIDVIYYFLRIVFYNLIFTSLIGQIKKIENQLTETKDEDKENLKRQLENHKITLSDVTTNTHKQSLSLWIGIIILVFFVIPGVKELATDADGTMLALAVISPILSGFIVSWFIVTFASIRKEFMTEGFIITFFMFSTFVLSLLTLATITWFFLPVKLIVVIYTIIIGGMIGSFKYDMVDLLRTGIDEQGLLFYKRANDRMEKNMPLF